MGTRNTCYSVHSSFAVKRFLVESPLCPISVIGQRVIIIDPIAHSPDIIGCKGCNAIERWIAVLSWGNTPTGTIPMLDELSISTPANRPDVISCESSGPEQLIIT